MQTITINDSAGNPKTFPAPTRVSPYPQGAISLFKPADGSAVVQRSSARGSTGDESGIRTLFWDLLPSSAPSGYSWTGTISILNALEGLTSVLTLGSTWGGLYSGGQNITVLSVRIEPRSGRVASKTWYSVTLEFIER